LIRLLALGALFALALAAGLLLPVWRVIGDLLGTARDAGAAGALLYAGAFVPAALLLLPTAPLAVGAGNAFGPIAGTLVSAVGGALGATAAFEAGRRIGGTGLRKLLARSHRLRPFARALEHAGPEVVFWLRLSPLVPFYLLNYAFGTTGLRTRDYALATGIAILPGCAIYALLGSLLPSTADWAHAGCAAPRWVALSAAIVLSVVAAVAARARLPRLVEMRSGEDSIRYPARRPDA